MEFRECSPDQIRTSIAEYLKNHGGTGSQKEVVSDISNRYIRWARYASHSEIRRVARDMVEQGKLVRTIKGFPPHRILSLPKS